VGGTILKKAKKRFAAGTALALGLIIPQVAPTLTYADVVNENVVKLRILETSDIHTNLVNYDYFQDKKTEKFGLSKTASLIQAARTENPNTLLFDNGDILQGTPLSDYVAKNIFPNVKKEEFVNPVFKVLNLLKYDGATAGNHEFNYGLDFLNNSIDDANFAYVNANVYHDDNADGKPELDHPYFKQYEILDREVTDQNGNKHTVKVGVTGFVPPDIMNWDSANLKGKVAVTDIVESAKKIVPEMKKAGADVVVVLSHSGISTDPYTENMENASYYVTQVPGVDVVLTGHQHKKFPALPGTAADYKDSAELKIDNAKGTINGIPVTMPSSTGDVLGQVDLTLEQVDGKWKVKDSQSALKPVADAKGTPLVESDKAVEDAVKDEHEATIKYVNQAVGKTAAPINSYFALVKDDPSVQIVNQAQKWYMEKKLATTEYKNLPVLSSAAPFKAGARGGANYYTDIKAGDLAIKNVADLYVYPNTVYALKLTGKEIKEWLEWSAGQFNQVDPSKTEEQSLVNLDFPTYNFDIIDGIKYQIDVTQPYRYKDYKVADENAHRIKNVEYDGKPLKDDQEFVVVTNNYRASTNQVINPGGKNTILASPDENRQVIIDYIRENDEINPTADNNWTFAPVNKDVNVTFESSPKAQAYLAEKGPISYIGESANSFAKYQLTLPKQATQPETPKQKFKDVAEDHWAYKYIQELTDKGVLKGVSTDMFNPNAAITRGQFVSIIARSLDLEAKKSSVFKDVPANSALGADIQAAYEAGIAVGTTKTRFEPSKPITRAQMAVLVMRAYDYKTGKTYKADKHAPYLDTEKLGDWAVPSIDAAYELGFMTGATEKSFKPQDSAKRDQAARVLYQLIQKF